MIRKNIGISAVLLISVTMTLSKTLHTVDSGSPKEEAHSIWAVVPSYVPCHEICPFRALEVTTMSPVWASTVLIETIRRSNPLPDVFKLRINVVM